MSEPTLSKEQKNELVLARKNLIENRKAIDKFQLIADNQEEVNKLREENEASIAKIDRILAVYGN